MDLKKRNSLFFWFSSKEQYHWYESFWRLEIRDPGTDRVDGLWSAIFSPCLHIIFPLCPSVSKFPLLWYSWNFSYAYEYWSNFCDSSQERRGHARPGGATRGSIRLSRAEEAKRKHGQESLLQFPMLERAEKIEIRKMLLKARGKSQMSQNLQGALEASMWDHEVYGSLLVLYDFHLYELSAKCLMETWSHLW